MDGTFPTAPVAPNAASSKKSLILPFLVLIVAVAVGVGGYYLGVGKTGTKKASPSALPNTSSAAQSALPVNLTNPGIESALVTYTFKGVVEALKTGASGLEIATSIKGNEIPKFVVGEKTKVFFVNNGKQTRASASDIAVGQNVKIVIAYALKKKSWNEVSEVRLIDVVPPATPSSVPQ